MSINQEYSDSSVVFFFFKQKTAYEIKECDWSSDVCSSDLLRVPKASTNWPNPGAKIYYIVLFLLIMRLTIDQTEIHYTLNVTL